MLYFLCNTISPRPLFSQNHQLSWISLRFISNISNSKARSFAISYLIDSCGLSPQRAASLSKYFRFETREKPDSVIHFFKSLGFSQTKALTIIRSKPLLLQTIHPHKSYLPKIEFFKSKGFSNSDIRTIISRNPAILKRSLHNEIIPSFDFFDQLFQCKDKLAKAIMRYSAILYDVDQYSAPNIKLLRQEGVPESNVIRLIEYFPATIKVSPKHFKDKVEELKELGFNTSTLNFVLAHHVKTYMKESTWASKEDIYRRWGWTDDDIRAAFRLHPHCMAISKDKMEAVMDYVVNDLGYESSAIARHPVLMSMSLGKRIIPRGSVIQVLMSKGLVNRLSLCTIFGFAEKFFLDKFVHCHEKEAGELLKLYQAKLALAR